METKTDIFTRLRNGETVAFNDPDYHKLRDVSFATRKLLLKLNQSADPEEMRELLSRITGTEIDESSAIFPPIYINYGRHTKIGKTFSSTSTAFFWTSEGSPSKTASSSLPK